MDKEKEIYHHGVKGMKWGHRNRRDGSSILYDHYRIKQEKHAQKVSGDSAYLKKMTDAERKAYGKGRVETMGSKAQAIRSETTNFAAKTSLTALKGVAATLTSTIGGAGLVMAASTGAEVVGALLGGALLGGVPMATIAVGTLAGQTIARGVRYMKNVNAIKNANGR